MMQDQDDKKGKVDIYKLLEGYALAFISTEQG